MAITLIAVLISGSIPLQSVFAQDFGGGVDKEGTWYLGEGLKHGDYFNYKLCFVDYKECTEFEMEFWIEGDIQVGSESKWLAQTVVYDGSKILKGTMELGKVAPEPTGGTEQLLPYRSAFKSSVAWLSAFATSYGGQGGEGPKEFSMPSWGKIGNIGGQQVAPTSLETVTTTAGTFETVTITWKTGGVKSEIWIVDEFPFPVKASTWTHVSSGIPPQEYRFELLDYKENVQSNPFVDIKEKGIVSASENCPTNYELVNIKKPTKNFQYQMNVKYGPENPKPGCPIEWIINFHSKYLETEFLNEVQYDIWVVDDQLSTPPLRSIAGEDNKHFLFSASGQVRTFTLVNEPPGTAHYVIWIYGLEPEFIVPSPTESDYLEIDIDIATGDGTVVIPTPITPQVPSWVKTSAGFWVSGDTSDSEFVSAIEYLINEGIIVIPPTSSGSGSGETDIPAWIKTTTGYWTDGLTTDDEFVSAIQYLIKNGIMTIG